MPAGPARRPHDGGRPKERGAIRVDRSRSVGGRAGCFRARGLLVALVPCLALVAPAGGVIARDGEDLPGEPAIQLGNVAGGLAGRGVLRQAATVAEACRRGPIAIRPMAPIVRARVGTLLVVEQQQDPNGISITGLGVAHGGFPVLDGINVGADWGTDQVWGWPATRPTSIGTRDRSTRRSP